MLTKLSWLGLWNIKLVRLVVCVCVCVLFRSICLKIIVKRCFWELNMLIGSLVMLYVGLHSCLCFSPLEKLVLKCGSTPPRYLAIYRDSQAFFISQSWQLLDTWWIDRESSCLLDSFSTPGGSIELLFLELISYCSIPQLSTSIFSTPTSIVSSTPLDTSSVEHYLRFYLNLLVRSGSHFTRSLSRLLPVFSPKLSHLTPISFLKGFFKIF